MHTERPALPADPPRPIPRAPTRSHGILGARLPIHPEGRFFVLASAGQYSPGELLPRPLLLLVIARSSQARGGPSPEDRAALQSMLERSQLEAQYWCPVGLGAEDVLWVGPEATSIPTPKSERNDPRLHLWTLGGALEDLGRTLLTRRGALVEPPQSFADKLALELRAPELPRGAWLDTVVDGADLAITLRLKARWLMEPGGRGQAQFLGRAVSVEVPIQDRYFNGSDAAATTVPLRRPITLGSLLTQPVALRRRASTAAKSERQETLEARELYFPASMDVRWAGEALVPLDDARLESGAHVHWEEVQTGDGPALFLELNEVLESPAGGLRGWTLDVGLRRRGEDGRGCFEPGIDQRGDPSLIKCEASRSGQQALALSLPEDRRGLRLELIVRNQDGVPVARRVRSLSV